MRKQKWVPGQVYCLCAAGTSARVGMGLLAHAMVSQPGRMPTSVLKTFITVIITFVTSVPPFETTFTPLPGSPYRWIQLFHFLFLATVLWLALTPSPTAIRRFARTKEMHQQTLAGA